MITLLVGDNSFERDRELDRLKQAFAGVPETIDGSQLETRQLPDVLMGATLFADRRLVIIKQLSDNTAVWNVLADWIPRIADDIDVVFVEPKPDKRTKTYKDLKSKAKVVECLSWGDRDQAKAERWLIQEAATQSVTLSPKLARMIVARVGVDQWQLYRAIEKLTVVDTVDETSIERVIEATPTASVFALFDTALSGDIGRIHQLIATLETTAEPYQVLSMLGSQAWQLAALVTSDKSPAMIAGDLGLKSSYGLTQLAGHRRRLTRYQARKIVAAFAEADHDSKTSAAEPWLLIERALAKVSSVCSRAY